MAEREICSKIKLHSAENYMGLHRVFNVLNRIITGAWYPLLFPQYLDPLCLSTPYDKYLNGPFMITSVLSWDRHQPFSSLANIVHQLRPIRSLSTLTSSERQSRWHLMSALAPCWKRHRVGLRCCCQLTCNSWFCWLSLCCWPLCL